EALAESLLLAAGGAVAGLALAYAGLRALVAIAPPELYADRILRIDAWVLGFTAAVAVLAGLLFGILPAWQISRVAGYETLKEGSRSGTATMARQRARAFLVVAEIALALVLLVGAGLFLRSFANVTGVNPGFDARGLMTAEVRLPRDAQDANPGPRWIQQHQMVLERLKSLPGVTGAAIGLSLPFSGSDGSSSFGIQGREQRRGDPGPHSRIRYVSPEYFDTLRVPVIRGRAFTDQDRMGAEPVALLDDNLARQYWPQEDPVGKYLLAGRNNPPVRIVGVVGNVKQTDLAVDTNKGIRYYPVYQRGLPFGAYIVRTTGDTLAAGPAMRQAIREVTPTQPVFNVESMEARIRLTLAPRRFVIGMLALFASTALFMASLGLYGVISYSVSQRTQEIGIRMALGAQRQQVVSLIVGQGIRLALAGVGVGFLAAGLLARLVATQLYQVSPFDPLTFVVMSAVLGLVALAASFLPARRATRIDPLVALRYE
ncbi:MAG: FtsX-like permease family protein, partial [Bryobacteraceae bacterium]